MNRIKRFVKKHQLISFFVLTYLTSWLLFLPFILTGDEQTFGILALIGLFCPAFVNILISRIITPASDENPQSRRRIAFWLTWVIATVIFTLHVKTTSGIESPVAIVFYAIIALLPAFVVASVFSKFPAVRRSLSSIFNPRGHIVWYLFALLMPWIIKLISIPISTQLGWSALSEPDRVYGISRWLGLVAISSLNGFVFAGGLNEETGWTGFALPRLQVSFSPLIASIILWFFWILWHIPMQVAGLWNAALVDFIRALIGSFFARFIFTWLFNKTRGGMLSAILFHASANASFEFLPSTHVHMILEAALAIFIIFVARMWQKLPADSPGMYKTAQETA